MLAGIVSDAVLIRFHKARVFRPRHGPISLLLLYRNYDFLILHAIHQRLELLMSSVLLMK